MLFRTDEQVAQCAATHPTLEESARVILTCAEALSLHEKPLITDNDTVLELYSLGISAHKLRRSYVEDRLDDYPDAGDTRQELMEQAEEDGVWASIFLRDTLSILDRVESQVIDGLLSGDIVALGYADPHDSNQRVVPSHQWHFLKLDFDKSVAIGTDLHYAGLRFIRNCELTDQQLNALRKNGQQEKKDNVVSFDRKANDWTDVTIRFLKDSIVGVGIQGKEQRIPLGALRLVNKTNGEPNEACLLLLKLANQQRVSSKQKHQVSNVKKLLQELFDLYNSKPFHHEKGRGYVPNFKLIDDRYVLDQRAKDKAVHVSLQEIEKNRKELVEGLVVSPSGGYDQDEHSYKEDGEMRDDAASAFIRERTDR